MQNSVATSSAEAEAYACVSAAQEMVYLIGFLTELNHPVPTDLFCLFIIKPVLH